MRHGGVQPRVFQRPVQKRDWRGFSKYLIQVRVDRAKELLRETSLSISEVCEAVGYSDRKHFTQTFHKMTGVNPAEFRFGEEYAPMLGADIFQKRIDELTVRQKYDLVFTRLLLQRPQVVFCIQPFKKAEVAIRSHIWELIDRLLKKGIAVVILAVNLADSLALADRLIRLRQGRVREIYDREDFAKLPANTPWLYLYKGKATHPQKEQKGLISFYSIEER